jgi:hypothetical protein
MGNTNSNELHNIETRLTVLENNLPKENRNLEFDKLEEEVKYLRKENKELEKKLYDMCENKINKSIGIETQPKLFGELSKAYIDSEIDKILANNDVNVSIIPDYYEKKIYRNIFNMLFGLLESITQTSEIKFLHHKITFSIQPDTPSPSNESISTPNPEVEVLFKSIPESVPESVLDSIPESVPELVLEPVPVLEVEYLEESQRNVEME